MAEKIGYSQPHGKSFFGDQTSLSKPENRFSMGVQQNQFDPLAIGRVNHFRFIVLAHIGPKTCRSGPFGVPHVSDCEREDVPRPANGKNSIASGVRAHGRQFPEPMRLAAV
jgi:hypothetical protein